MAYGEVRRDYPFNCCNLGFQNDGVWAFHFIKKHVSLEHVKDVGYAVCPLCVSKFTGKTNVMWHIQSHHVESSEEDYLCPTCDYSSVSKKIVD